MKRYPSKVSASPVAVLRSKRYSYLGDELLIQFLEWQGYETKGRLITPQLFKKPPNTQKAE